MALPPRGATLSDHPSLHRNKLMRIRWDRPTMNRDKQTLIDLIPQGYMYGCTFRDPTRPHLNVIEPEVEREIESLTIESDREGENAAMVNP
jgi:hypothetical protein